MHDIDRTQLEMPEFGELDGHREQGEYGEFGEATEFGEYGELAITEIQEMELASELLEVGSAQELEQFLGNVFRTVQNAAGQFVRSDTGRALGGILRQAARKAVPVVGRAVGQWIGPQYAEPMAGLASDAARVFGLELEGLSQEDREFEIARQFVRFATAATQQAARSPSTVPPVVAARRAAAAAARLYAPGLIRLRGRSGALWPRGGRWVRRGRTIVLYGG